MSRSYKPYSRLPTDVPLDQTLNNVADAHPRERTQLIVVANSYPADPQIEDRRPQSAKRARSSRSTGMGNMPDFPIHPPSLSVNRIVPLPVLTAGMPIFVHPLLQYHPTILSIAYDFSLPPTSAQCPASTTHIEYRSWRHQAAILPSSVTSLTIRMPGVERPVVVLSSRRDSTVVTINDVLGAVSRAAREAVLYQVTNQARGDAFGLSRRGYVVQQAPSYTEAQLTSAVRRRSSGAHWWGGLYASPTERDVWVLHTSEYTPR